MLYEVITAVDLFGQSSAESYVFYVTNLSIPRDESPAWSDDTLRASAEVTIPASGKVPASTGTATVALERIVITSYSIHYTKLYDMTGKLWTRGRSTSRQRARSSVHLP